MKQNMDLPSCKWNLLKVFILICTTLASTLSYGQAGNAPMQFLPQFPGNFAIDGFLQRQGANGDWLQAAGGSANNFVFSNAGVPVPGLIAFRLTDLFDDQVNDDIFDGGNKLFQDPNTWGWRSQKPPAKDDMNNALVFVALNPADQHIWLAIAGDRMSTNGTSYLDFEFYQNSITKTGGPIPGGTGGFLSTGPHGGRTVGDISITLEFTNGGSLATVKYLQWQPGSEAGSFDYFDLTPDPGTAFAAANAGAVNVPYGAFGATTYDELQFAEGAIDLTAVIGGSGLPTECGSLPFETLFIKTKSSAEKTADLKDFISPLQINICFDRTAPTINCPNTLNLGCNPTIPPPSGATASDNCNGPIIPVAADGPVSSNGCSRSMTRIWRATDGCGNSATCGQLITWTSDNTPPVFTGSYADENLGCNPANPDASLGSASASDACGSVTISISDGPVTSDGCNRAKTRTFVARDACTNTSSVSRTVRWTADATPPTLTTGGGPLTLGCNPSSGDINTSLGTATATDGCGTPTVTSSDNTIQVTGCGRSQTRTFTARDFCGNTSTAARTVTWTVDVTPPQFTGSYATVPLACNPAASDITGALNGATATDACGNPTVTQSDGNVSSDGCARSQTRTFTARDACGNTATVSRTVTWTSDVTPPQFTGSYATVPLGCNPAASDINAALDGATATDGCGNPTISQSDGNVSSNGCARSQTRTFTARDGCGNTATIGRTVTWTADNTPPQFTGSYTTVQLGCNPAASDIAGALGSASATDACGQPTVTQSDGPVTSDGCGRSQIRTFTARDGCNNTATVSRRVNWTTNPSPPTFTGSYATVPLGCNPAASDINAALDGATATSACGSIEPTSSDGPVSSNGCSRSQTRTFTASDGCGNSATVSRTVTWTSDVTPPTFTGSYATVPLGCNPAASDITGALDGATATDACGNPTVTQSDGNVISTGCARSQTRTFTARDGCNNTSTVSRTVTWTSDVTPPVFTGDYGPINLGCNPTGAVVTATLAGASATDACGQPSITQSDGNIQSNGCSRTATRTFTARDACGNTATISRSVSYTEDVTPPVITTGGTGTALGCNPSANDIGAALGTATATDGCGPTTISQSDGNVSSNGCGRSQTRTWTARDVCGNTSTASRTATWTADVTPPVITSGGTTNTLGCNPVASDINGALGTANATDACGVPTISSSDGNVSSNGCGRSQTRTWTARDFCGNTSTAARTVTWTVDVTAPVFVTTPASVDIACDAPVPTAATPTASDACGTPTVTQTGTTDNATDCSTGFQRVVTRTWTARDACGNTATYTQTIRVECCPSIFCTYTMGQYGTDGGSACDGTNSYTTAGIIAKGLSAWPGGVLTVGKPGNSIVVTNTAADIACVIDVLPANQGSREIEAGNFGICNLSASMLTNQHRLKNVLAGQTITLGINMGVSPQLGGFALQAGVLATQDLVNGCGSTTPETRICHYNTLAPFQLTSVENEYTYRTFTQALIDAIPGTNNVANLFELANRALANVDGVVGSEGGVSLDVIQQAVANINEGFDNCKSTVGWNIAPCPATDPTPGDGKIAATTVAPALEVTAYPNPYQENFSLKVNSPVTGQASVSFYTIDGVKISEMKRDVVAKRDVWIPFNVPAVYRTRIVYTVNVGSHNAKGVVLSPN